MYTRKYDSQTISSPRCEDEFIQNNVGSLIRKTSFRITDIHYIVQIHITSSVKKY